MTRRRFIRALGLGTVGVCATLHVPASVLQAVQLPTKEYAADRLRREFLRFVKAHGIRELRAFYTGRELHHAYAVELPAICRFTRRDEHGDFGDHRGFATLLFKGYPVIERGLGWTAQAVK